MADIDYFLKQRWRVTGLSGALNGHLPAKGSTIKIELRQNGRSKTCRMVAVTSTAKRVFDGFQFKNGRLELQISNPDRVLIVEEDKPVRGKPRLKAHLTGRQQSGRGGTKTPPKPLPRESTQGTWGAESGGGGGNVYPAGQDEGGEQPTPESGSR